MIIKIRPVLRYPGSKWGKAYNGKPDGWKVDKIIQILNIKANDIFLDMFGGSGIVGVNVKHLTKASVIINDFDCALPVKDYFAIRNICSFRGMNKSFTKDANEYAIRRIKNGYWKKVDKYNEVLNNCVITHFDWIENKQIFLLIYARYLNQPNKFYIDPPYIKGLYKKSFSNNCHKILANMLNELRRNNPQCKILISYDNKPFIRNLYKDWYIHEEEFQYSVTKGDRRTKVNELFITNFKWKN